MKNLIHYFIPRQHFADESKLKKSKVLIWALFITWLFTLTYALTSLLIGFTQGFVVEFTTSFIYLLLPVVFKITGNTKLVANLCIGTAVVAIFLCTWYSGGYHSPVYPWFAFPPIVIMLISGKRSSWFWLAVSAGIVIFLGILNMNGFTFPEDYNLAYKNIFSLICYTGLVVIIFLIALVFSNQRDIAFEILNTKNEQLQLEKERSDDLLHNILPAETIEELKKTGTMTARNYDRVTVLFADIESFTTICEEMTPDEIVRGIGEYFEAFDKIITEFEIEKIKTIGDSYVCAGGLPSPTDDNAEVVVDAAIKILQCVEEISEKRRNLGLVPFHFRFGIHTGPLIAGVVGIKKFAYDIWGDTVNIAARMEESSEVGKINISGYTYKLVKHLFQCEYRGKVEAKNKGTIDMYYVHPSYNPELSTFDLYSIN